MTWRETKVEDERKQFIELYLQKKLSIAELSRQFNISRPIAYKWIDRFMKNGWDGLKDHSRAPKTQSRAISSELESEILKVKLDHLKWGPKKVKGSLEKEKPAVNWPSRTTIGKIFERNGLLIPRKLRKRLAERESPLTESQQCNDTWCIDFKGWWLTKDNCKCDPLTVTDFFSRYLFSCVKLKANDAKYVWAHLDILFREYGLPLFLRSDNGPPFATSSPGRLSSLSIKLIKAGVMPEWIEPGQPQQNGRHERMHLTLQGEGIDAGLTLEEQEMKFAEFIQYYNYVRPHEALGQKYPGEVYRPSNRSWSGRLKSPEYTNEYTICKVRDCGKMSWKGGDVYIGRVLKGEPVGIKENEQGLLTVHYGPIYLGTIDGNELNVIRRKSRSKRSVSYTVNENRI